MNDGFIPNELVGSNMRAKTIPHVEYEIFQHILDEIDISILKEQMCPSGDAVAADRFDKGAESAAQLIQNLIERRKHRLPFDHPDFEAKGSGKSRREV